MQSIRAAFRRAGLVRSSDQRVLGGVVAGLGQRLGINPWPARLLFILVLMLLPGSQLLAYPILWILMPRDIDPIEDASVWNRAWSMNRHSALQVDHFGAYAKDYCRRSLALRAQDSRPILLLTAVDAQVLG